ncbi:hypothetical protein ACRRTK_002928 [Alexandromys fortis]
MWVSSKALPKALPPLPATGASPGTVVWTWPVRFDWTPPSGSVVWTWPVRFDWTPPSGSVVWTWPVRFDWTPPSGSVVWTWLVRFDWTPRSGSVVWTWLVRFDWTPPSGSVVWTWPVHFDWTPPSGSVVWTWLVHFDWTPPSGSVVWTWLVHFDWTLPVFPVSASPLPHVADVCNSTNLPEVEIISLLEEQLPHYKLRADTIYGYDHDDWLHTPLISPDASIDLTTEQIEETLKYFRWGQQLALGWLDEGTQVCYACRALFTDAEPHLKRALTGCQLCPQCQVFGFGPRVLTHIRLVYS